MRNFFWIITLLGCAVGGLIGVVGVVTANGAPQEAAAAAIAVGCAVIPYCFARAVDEIGRQGEPAAPAGGMIARPAESKAPNVVCGVCDHENPPRAKSCAECGATFAQYAPLPRIK